MIGLPREGQRVKVWPFPGLKVQANEHPVDRWGGGHYLAEDGEEVIWNSFQHEQLKAGQILMHAPHPADPNLIRNRKKTELAEKAKADEPFSHARATQEHMERATPKKAALITDGRSKASNAAALAEKARIEADEAAALAAEEAAHAKQRAQDAAEEAYAAEKQAQQAADLKTKKAEEAKAAADEAAKLASEAAAAEKQAEATKK